MGIFQKGISPGAFGGSLSCPVCQSTAIRFVENIGPYRLRYRCRKCGLPFQYETGKDLMIHPYAPYKKVKFQEIVEAKVKPKRFVDFLLRRKKLIRST